MPRTNVILTIPAGQSLSNAVDCRSGAPVLLYTPTEWTPAKLSYLISHDGVTFRNLFDRDTGEISIKFRPGTVLKLNPNWTESALGAYVKFRSGTSKQATTQTADRVFTLMIDS